MKKILILLLVLPFLASCSSDDKEDENKKLQDALIGTTWQHTYEESEIKKVVTYTIHFISDGKHRIERTWYEEGELIPESSYVNEYNYIYTPPSIVIQMSESVQGRGEIAGNNMMVTSLYDMTFTKIK